MNTVDPEALLRSARLLRGTLSFLLAVVCTLAVVQVGYMLVDVRGLGRLLAANLATGAEEVRIWQGTVLGVLVLVQIGIWAAILWRGRQIFAALVAEDVSAAGGAARRAAQLLWVILIVGVLAHSLGTVVATWHFPEGQRSLSVTLGTAQISTALAALLASFTSRAFALGAALWQDHKAVI